MSNDDKQDDTRKTIDPSVTKRIRKAIAGGYEVGYGKPPTATRFRKGTSGNPAGRPRRKKPPQETQEPSAAPGPVTRVMREELTRDIVVQEAGEAKTMPLPQAMFRNMTKQAFAGSVNATKEVLRLSKEEARQRDAEIAEDHAFWREHRDTFEAKARALEEAGQDVPDWIPRPEDIDIRPDRLTVIHGPKSPEEMVHYVKLARIRDQSIAKARYDSVRFPASSRGALKLHEIQIELLLPYWLDKMLPKRMQLSDDVIQERLMRALWTSHERLRDELLDTLESEEFDEADREALLNEPGLAVGHGIYTMADRLGIDWTQLQAKAEQRPKRYRARPAAD